MNKDDEITKCIEKYIASKLKISQEARTDGNIDIIEIYDNDVKVITVYEDKTSGEVGIIENWKVK